MTAPAADPTVKKPRPRWLKILIIAGVVLVVLIILGALFGPKKTDTPAAAATTTSAAATTTSEAAGSTVASTPTGPSERPQPTEAQVRQIGLQLAEIQPEMAEITVSRIESWSDSMCADIWAGEIQDLAGRAVQRFAGGDRPPLTPEQGQQIVDAITTTYCHP